MQWQVAYLCTFGVVVSLYKNIRVISQDSMRKETDFGIDRRWHLSIDRSSDNVVGSVNGLNKVLLELKM